MEAFSLWDKLSDELKIAIFSEAVRDETGVVQPLAVCRLATVSRDFCRLAGDASLWRKLAFAQPAGEVPVLSLVRRAAGAVRELCFKAGVELSGDAARALADLTPALSSLILSKWSHADAVPLGAMCHRWPALARLELARAQLADGAVDALAQHCPKLTHLSLDRCKNFSLAPLAARECVCALVSLALDHSWRVSPAELVALAGRHGATLQALSLRACTGAVTDASLRAIAPALTQLQLLDVALCSNGSAAGLAAVVRTCAASLRTLHVDGCEYVDAACLQQLAALAPPRLAALRLDAAGRIGDAAVAPFVAACGAALTSLNLAGLARLSSEAVEAVAAHCPRLRSLSLAGCGHVRSEAIVLLAQRCGALRELDLAKVMKLTSAGACALAEHLPGLQLLRLDSCINVGDAALVRLASAMHDLRELGLQLLHISDVALEALAAHCPALASLDLVRCESVTDAGLQAVLAGCPRLAFLNLWRAHAITDAGRRAAQARVARVNFAQRVDFESVTQLGLETYAATQQQAAAARPGFRSAIAALELRTWGPQSSPDGSAAADESPLAARTS